MLPDQDIQEMKPTAQEAARFLSHATLGYTTTDINYLMSRGYLAWLNAQFAIPLNAHTSHFDWLMQKYPPNDQTSRYDPWYMTHSVVRRITEGTDGLRQKLTFSLSQIVTASARTSPEAWYHFAAAGYYDMIESKAFGTYEQLLQGVSTHYFMAYFLTYLDSQAANENRPPAGQDGKNARPDENYAREFLQLFSIGVDCLDPQTWVPVMNNDVTPPRPHEAYSIAEIRKLAQVFTGFVRDRSVPNPQCFKAGQKALQNVGNWHHIADISLDFPQRSNAAPSSESRTTPIFLAGNLPADQKVEIVVRKIAGHHNVPGFIARQLIQRFTTSNPSQQYVMRVAKVFQASGGDLKQVVKAILFDEDLFTGSGSTRRYNGLAGPRPGDINAPGPMVTQAAGKLREPFSRVTQWAKAFGAKSASGLWNTGDYREGLLDIQRVSQAPMLAPSVFNFYRPGYVPPASVAAKKTVNVINGATVYKQAIVAPEFQITDENTAVSYINLVFSMVDSERGLTFQKDITANYTAWLPKADQPLMLVTELNVLLAAGALSSATTQIIIDTIATLPTGSAETRRKRVQAAIALVMVSPEYLIQK